MYIADVSYSKEEQYELIENLRQNGFTVVIQGKRCGNIEVSFSMLH